MSRIKFTLVVLFLSVIVGIVPQASATAKPTVQVTIGGASAAWQSLALAAYSAAGAGGGHWTSASNVVDLTDSRVSPVNIDAGTLWVVWNKGATKVWSYNNVDSIVGVRCYFAQPHCTVNATSANLAGTGSNQISSSLWGDGSSDTALPATLQSLFTTGTPVTVAATIVRPEDAAFITCRANSQLGAGSYGGAASDGLDGLGYNSVNAPGVCPASGLGQASGAYVGSPILSGYPKSTAAANVLAYNISGVDPITGDAIPEYTVENVGAAPLVFITERNEGQLTNLTNATPEQLQKVFSGADCDAGAFGLPAGGINIFLYEGISGIGNTAEATLFRRPTVYTGTGTGSVLGLSQESNVGSNNPLNGQSGTCLAGAGARRRAIGSSEEVKSVQNSGKNYGTDGIGYNVFSYGNVSTIANSSAYGYIQVNGIDPIFASYSGDDPGQPGSGTIPGSQNLPASCSGAFPCPEKDIWTGGLSFPNVRNGTYPSWAIIRLLSNGTALARSLTLITRSQEFAVSSVPDFVPFKLTKVTGLPNDPGLTYLHSHYQQYDGAGNLIGAAPVNTTAKEAGGEVGGCIEKTTGKTEKITQSVSDSPNPCVTRP